MLTIGTLVIGALIAVVYYFRNPLLALFSKSKGRPPTKYDARLTFDVSPMTVRVEAMSDDLYEKLGQEYMNETLVIFGDFGIGKTFFLGRLGNCSFEYLSLPSDSFHLFFFFFFLNFLLLLLPRDESITRQTKGFSLKRFSFMEEDREKFITFIDNEGWNYPVDAGDEKGILMQISKENLTSEISFRVGDFIVLMLDKCSAENSRKIFSFRKRAFRENKELLVVYNFRNASTRQELTHMKKEQVDVSFGYHEDAMGLSFCLRKDENEKKGQVSVYWLGNDSAPETKKHNDKVFKHINEKIKAGNFPQKSPLTEIRQSLGAFLPEEEKGEDQLPIEKTFSGFSPAKAELKIVENTRETIEGEYGKVFFMAISEIYLEPKYSYRFNETGTQMIFFNHNLEPTIHSFRIHENDPQGHAHCYEFDLSGQRFRGLTELEKPTKNPSGNSSDNYGNSFQFGDLESGYLFEVKSFPVKNHFKEVEVRSKPTSKTYESPNMRTGQYRTVRALSFSICLHEPTN